MSPLPPFLAVEEEPLSTTQLDEALAEVRNPELLPEPVRRWEITGTATAEWAMSRLAWTVARRAEVESQARVWRERIDSWERSEIAPLDARAAFFEHHLERYALAQREADPRAKSVKLPSGTVRTTAKGPKVIVADEEAVIEWAKSSLGERAASVVRVTERVMVGELKEVVRMVETEDGFYAAVSEDGQVVPGVEVEPPSVSAKAVPDVD